MKDEIKKYFLDIKISIESINEYLVRREISLNIKTINNLDVLSKENCQLLENV